MKRKVRLSTVILILVIATGLSLMFYPFASNYINSIGHKSIINDYISKTEDIGDDEYQAMLEAAREYNKRLLQRTPYITNLTDEQRKEYESLLNIMGNGVMGYIEIPAADVSLAIYHGTEEEVLRVGAGHMEGSSLPVGGSGTHTVLSGHRGFPSDKLFSDIDVLDKGDIFTLHILKEVLTYQVDRIQTVEPDKADALMIEEDRDYCTLITCTPYGVNTHRLLIRGHRIETPKQDAATQNTAVPDGNTAKWYMQIIVPAAVVVIVFLVTLIVIRHKKRKL